MYCVMNNCDELKVMCNVTTRNQLKALHSIQSDYLAYNINFQNGQKCKQGSNHLSLSHCCKIETVN